MKLMKAYPTLQLFAKSSGSQSTEQGCAVYELTDAKVHEVITTQAGDIDDVLQHDLINTVRDIAQHDLKMVSPSQRKGGENLQ